MAKEAVTLLEDIKKGVFMPMIRGSSDMGCEITDATLQFFDAANKFFSGCIVGLH